jgi:hypothetical protein
MSKVVKNFNELVEYIQYNILILKKSPYLHPYVVDGIRNNIFYMSQTKEFFSGFYSKEAYQFIVSGGSHSKLCKEHHYGLKGLTERLIEMNLSNDDMKQFIKQNATYNWTTKDENMQLKLNKQSYEKCIIELNTFNDWCTYLGYPHLRKKIKLEPVNGIEHSWW